MSEMIQSHNSKYSHTFLAMSPQTASIVNSPRPLLPRNTVMWNSCSSLVFLACVPQQGSIDTTSLLCMRSTVIASWSYTMPGMSVTFSHAYKSCVVMAIVSIGVAWFIALLKDECKIINYGPRWNAIFSLPYALFDVNNFCVCRFRSEDANVETQSFG